MFIPDSIAAMGRAFGSEPYEYVDQFDKYTSLVPQKAIDHWARHDPGYLTFFSSVAVAHAWWAVELQHIYTVERVELNNIDQTSRNVGCKYHL